MNRERQLEQFYAVMPVAASDVPVLPSAHACRSGLLVSVAAGSPALQSVADQCPSAVGFPRDDRTGMQFRHDQRGDLTALSGPHSRGLPRSPYAWDEQAMDDDLKGGEDLLPLRRKTDRLENTNHRDVRPLQYGSMFCAIHRPV